ncbi:DUF6692 family protein [Microvirga splendida]|uniref:DUF6692 domain-containing protein n=1 Tax=Microvirga splendida TaxID=2795727 RepID=A0ABS0XZJ4_9HYPH|nr:DUF6692 family protein [Microvirga splendida]MBJ6125470.1 hypothetical protein [Microvirga splendida]
MAGLFLPAVRRHLLPALALGLLAGCGDSAAPDDVVNPIRMHDVARILPAEQALAGAHIPTLDPHTMNDAEIEKAIGTGSHCDFRYTSSGRPVLAFGVQPGGAPTRGVVKLNGSLVALTPASATEGAKASGSLLLLADPVRISVAPDAPGEGEDREGARHREASMIFEIGQNLQVGYRGYLDCMPEPQATSAAQ